MEKVQTLFDSPYIALISLAVAIIGIVLAVIFFIKSQKNKTPCYLFSSNTIIEGVSQTFDEIEIRYKGQAQDLVSVTKLLLWNAGRETIDKTDLVERDQLRVTAHAQIDLLDVHIIGVSTESNLVTLGKVTQQDKSSTFSINFDFLDHADYFVIQIIHNGTSSENFSIAGKIKGVKKIVQSNPVRLSESQAKAVRLLFFPSLVMENVMEKLLANQRFMKYLIILSYGGLAISCLWLLISGVTEWYVWLGAGFGIFISCFAFFIQRHLPPVKI